MFNTVTLHFVYRMRLCVSYDSYNKHQLFSVQRTQIFLLIEARCVLCELALESLYIVVLRQLISTKNEDGIILTLKPGGKTSFGKPRLRWEDNIKVYI